MTTRTRNIVATLTMLLVITAGTAKDKKDLSVVRTYDAPYEKVWQSCLVVASLQGRIRFSDKASGVLVYRDTETPTHIGIRQTDVVLRAISENQTEVTATVQHKQYNSKRFFEALDQRLKQQ